jgi:hypothetical protein
MGGRPKFLDVSGGFFNLNAPLGLIEGSIFFRICLCISFNEFSRVSNLKPKLVTGDKEDFFRIRFVHHLMGFQE